MVFFKFVPIGQLLWGIRNTYFFVGFLALSVYYLSAEDIETLQEVINKTLLTKEKMLQKLLLEAIKKRQKELCYWILKAKG